MDNFNVENWGDKTVGAIFNSIKYATGYDKIYTYRIPLEMKVKKGNLAIVEKDGIYSFVTIVRIDKESKLDKLVSFKYKWILCIVETEKYFERQVEENKLTKNNAVLKL